MNPNEKYRQIRKILVGCLAAAVLAPCAYAAPDCVMKYPNGWTFVIKHYDEKLGHCVLMEVLDPDQNDGAVMRTTYDSGKVQYMSASKATGFQVKTEHGDFIQWGGDWPQNEYTRHLPDPGIGKEKAPFMGVDVKKGRPDDWGLVAVWFAHDEEVFKQLTSYPGKLKRMGFTKATDDGNVTNELMRDEKFSPDALMLISYDATNSAGYRARVFCGRPLQSAPDSQQAVANPLATVAAVLPRLLPCLISLESPVRARQRAKEEAARKAKDAEHQKESDARKKIRDDFADYVDNMPDD